MIDYFPVDLVKTVDLSPDRHYLVGACPHGILWYGIFFILLNIHFGPVHFDRGKFHFQPIIIFLIVLVLCSME